jgi:hypothetical protein
VELNGSYAYEVGPIAGFRSNRTGNVSVDGAAVQVPIRFSGVEIEFSITFVQTGLPTGIVWSISIGSHSVNTSGSDLVLQEPNGTYAYSVGTPPGFNPVSPGQFTVAGTGVQVPTIQFQSSPVQSAPTGGTPASGQGSTAIDIALGLGFVGFVIALGVVIWSVGRRTPESTDPTWANGGHEHAPTEASPGSGGDPAHRGYESDADLDGWDSVGSPR